MLQKRGAMSGNLNEFVLKFDNLVNDFYTDKGLSSESFRKGPCLYFHAATIVYVRDHSQPFATWLPENKYFHELLYATLTAWGMNRLGGGPKLKDFQDFQCSIRNLSNLDALEHLRLRKLEDISEKDRFLVQTVFEALGDDLKCKIMASKSFVVASSKLLHHLIPDLFPPMDRTYTEYALKQFDDKYKISGFLDGFKNFWLTLMFFRDATRELNPKKISEKWIIGKNRKYPMNTSIPKVLDNAFVSYAWGL